MNDLERREIEEAVNAADEALYHLERAQNYLGSARNWGLLDLFGGGFISGLVKHSKMGDAEQEIEAAKMALQRFSKELRDVSGYSSIHINEFLSFADFVFDGFLTDILVQSKISEARSQCAHAIDQVERIREELISKLD